MTPARLHSLYSALGSQSKKALQFISDDRRRVMFARFSLQLQWLRSYFHPSRIYPFSPYARRGNVTLICCGSNSRPCWPSAETANLVQYHSGQAHNHTTLASHLWSSAMTPLMLGSCCYQIDTILFLRAFSSWQFLTRMFQHTFCGLAPGTHSRR